MSSYLFNFHLHARSELNVWLLLVSLSLLPITCPSQRSCFKNVSAHKILKVARELWLVREHKLPSCFVRIHWREPLLKWNVVRYYGGVSLFSICSLCATGVLIIFEEKLFLN